MIVKVKYKTFILKFRLPIIFDVLHASPKRFLQVFKTEYQFKSLSGTQFGRVTTPRSLPARKMSNSA